jgi:FkbM family methyltransferase
MALFAGYIHQGDVVFDIGANVGVYSLVASRLVGQMGTVFAFEPLPRNLTFLRRHIDMNNARNVTVFAAAVGAENGVASFAATASPAMGRLSVDGLDRVDVVALDELIASGDARVPTMVKIDVEGGELGVLHGGAQTFSRHHPMVFLATHGTAVHEPCCQLLRKWGYTLEAVGGGDVANVDEVIAHPPV